MIEEVVYTSVERGLNPTQQGYCVVAQSKEISTETLDRLLPITSMQQSAANADFATNYSHFQFHSLPHSVSCLSRVGDGGLDYSGRKCFLAHHIVIGDSRQKPAAGPAWTCALRTLFYKQWNIRPGFLKKRDLPKGNFDNQECRLWKTRIGTEAGALRLCEHIKSEGEQPIYIVYRPELRLLPLLVEAIALLPPEWRWKVTFSTCFSSSVPGLKCQWRGVFENSDLHQQVIEKSLPMVNLAS